MKIRRLLGMALTAALLLPSGSAAQVHEHRAVEWGMDGALAAANIVISGLSASLTAVLRGEDVSRAFRRGAAGGALIFGGKRIAVERFDGAGLLGRQVGSVGSSVVANAGAGRDWFEEVWLPAGPLWIQVSSGERRRVRLNLRDVGTLAWAIHRSELEMDWTRSLSNGAMTFVSPRHRIVSGSREAAGVTIGGVVLLGVTHLDPDVVHSHENVHVIQHDFLLQIVGRPIEAWGWSHVTDRDVPLDVAVLPSLIYSTVVRNVAEAEADYLEVR